MNAIFLSLFLGATAILLFVNPPLFLPTVLDAAGDAATLCVALLASYAVWMGLMEVWKACGITKGISKLLRPLCKRLFRTDDEQTLQAISANLSCNFLGLGGAATPYGIEGARLLDKSPNPEYASCMFFALNATSLQLLPTSVVGLRASLGSGAPADIVLPSLICTAFSTAVACLLVWLFLRPKKRKSAVVFGKKRVKISNNTGAGTR